jgi:hypothetical protein
MIHLIYPHKNLKSAPNIIGHTLLKHFDEKYGVRAYNNLDCSKIDPVDGDILIGHPNLVTFNIFNRSLDNSKWRRKILLHPFNHDWEQISYLEPYIDKVDSFLAISGKYWHRNVSDPRIARWMPKVKQLDLAVEPMDFPKVKHCYNPPGKRKFLYIGNTNPGKNVSYLREISIALPDLEISHIGTGNIGGNVRALGYRDLQRHESLKLISEYDFLLTVGTFDANPTTILEAICWGLVPICSPSSGYENEPGIINISVSDFEHGKAKIAEVQNMPSDKLTQLHEVGYSNIIKHYNWKRFLFDVDNEINSKEIHHTNCKDNSLDYNISFPISKSMILRSFVLSNAKRIFRNMRGRHD